MVRDGELKLGGSLVHPLQSLPDGAHVRRLPPLTRGTRDRRDRTLARSSANAVLTADARAGRALSFPRSPSGAERTKVGCGGARKARAIALPGNRRRSHFDARPRRGYDHMFRRTDGRTDGPSSRRSRALSERTGCHRPRVSYTYTHARVRAPKRMTSAGGSHPGSLLNPVARRENERARRPSVNGKLLSR